MKLTIVSGRSGSGKSVCLHMLEDLGFYCIDNLPVGLLPALLEHNHAQHPAIAVSIDARNLPDDLNRFTSIITDLKKNLEHCEIVFFDAENETLLKRFSETRRKHPLSSDKLSLTEALEYEKQLLEPIAKLADLRIDSTRLTVQQLREMVHHRITPNTAKDLSLLFESFGYKSGVPTDADYVFDVRCLANPYWESHLRGHTGKDSNVEEFLLKHPQTNQLLEDIKKFLDAWLPHFATDNRNYMTIAIGCTGGQHRSVYMVEQLANYFRKQHKQVQVRHRELK